MSLRLPPAVTRLVTWIDENLLFVMALFLLAFIPLYPKIPLWSPIEQYIVRVRIEDLFIFGSAVLFGIQVLRKKVVWRSPMFWMMVAYAIVGFISTIVAIFVIDTVPQQTLHIGKTVLHYVRYLQYFSLFYILFASIKKRSQAVMVVAVVALTVLAISLYGYGQRYFYWPVYSTMNREFSKGVRLYLTPNARVQSTFGGTYDMAAYLVVALPLLLACAYQVRRKWASTGLHWVFWLGSWLLILSASRTPFAAYVGGVGLVVFITGLLQKTWMERFQFWISRTLVVLLFSSMLVYYFGSDLRDRLGFALNSQPQIKATIAGFDDQRKKLISDDVLNQFPVTPTRLQAMLPKMAEPPKQSISTDDAVSQIALASPPPVASTADQPPTPVVKVTPKPKPAAGGPALPGDVYEDIPDVEVVATTSANGTVTYVTRQKPRVYSECALKQELSLCIRQEVLWPRAIEGFLTNPVTGSGYATLTKESVDQFTEADSTDNNFLRTLGETGALGFITFYGCVVLVIWMSARHVRSEDRLVRAVSVGMLCGTVGLLLNAVYIDVFAASKVAQSFWALSGLLFATIAFDKIAKKTSSPVYVQPRIQTAGPATAVVKSKNFKRRK